MKVGGEALRDCFDGVGDGYARESCFRPVHDVTRILREALLRQRARALDPLRGFSSPKHAVGGDEDLHAGGRRLVDVADRAAVVGEI